MKKALSYLFFRYVSNFFYLIGISIVIPFVVNFSVPEKLLFLNMPKTLLIVMAIIFVAIGMLGTYFRKGEIGKAFRSLGFLTLIPALISIFILIFGDELIINAAQKTGITTLVDFSLRSVPGVWILTVCYIAVAIAWFWLWRRFK